MSNVGHSASAEPKANDLIPRPNFLQRHLGLDPVPGFFLAQ